MSKNSDDKTSGKKKEATKLKSNFKPEDYKKAVKKTKDYIKAGDIIQAVIAQRWKTKLDVDPFDLYRSLRVLNPSPYMFYLTTNTEKLVGSSPEVMVRVEEGEVESRPIAGTRPRGKNEKEDLKLEKELLADPKERAEHIMLVDLARNDLGRISDTGTVKVDELMIIERYSHVMHIVSNVISKLSKKKDALIGPLRSGAGFHVLKILELRGVETVEVEEVNARHILVSPSIILSDQKAEKMLKEFRTKLIEGEEDFAELAKEYSEDPGSALKGGILGWNDPSIYVPEFKEALSTLEKNEYSQPIRTVHGWHLIQLLERRIDDATEKRKEDRAYQLLFNRKFNEETDTWLREMRDGAYIELLDKRDL